MLRMNNQSIINGLIPGDLPSQSVGENIQKCVYLVVRDINYPALLYCKDFLLNASGNPISNP